jgi:CheY-like chemotaxis protein
MMTDQPLALIIDDNQMNIDVLEMLLVREGVECSFVTTPRNLDEVLDQIPHIQVVFLDLEIPNYDGLALGQQLREDQRLQGVPIVAYTVHADRSDWAKDAGFHSWLSKPLNVQRFPEQLQMILNNEPVWDVR